LGEGRKKRPSVAGHFCGLTPNPATESSIKHQAMITRITDLPDYVAGFEASGEVTKADYDNVVIPVVNAITKRTGELYYLFVIKTDLNHFTAGAWWDDMKIGLEHITHWKKMAIVSDSRGIEKFTDFFSFVVPGEAKGFQLEELEKAKEWVSKK
jgi:hypothetical protein